MKKDEDIIYWTNELQLATRSHLATLTGRNPKSLHLSLQRLVRARTLFCNPRRLFEENVYATYDIRKRMGFDHDLPLSDIHVALSSSDRLLEWNQPRQKLKGQVNEDTVFLFSFKDSSIRYYLEYETGTNGWWQVEDKMKRYTAKRSKERFNVLFVLKDEQRKTVYQMRKRAEKFLERDKPSTWKFFLFTTLEKITTQPLGKICMSAYDTNHYPLSPDLL